MLSVTAAHADKIRDEGIIATEPAHTYAGTSACAECHPQQYKHWSKTLKANFVRFRDNMTDLPGKWDKSPLKADKHNIYLVVGLSRKVAFVDKNWMENETGVGRS